MADKTLNFTPFGRFGIETAQADGHLIVRIPLDRKKAHPPAEGKKLSQVANSGGWQTVPGTDLRVNIGAGFA